MKTVAVFAVKGGVGKTAAAVALAHASATLAARRTLLWDLDPQAAASFILGMDDPRKARARAPFAGELGLADLVLPTAYANLRVLPADRSLRRLEADLAAGDRAKLVRKLLRALDGFDRVFIDCPPGLGGLAERLFRAADLVAVPLVPGPLSGRAFDQLRDHLAGSAPLLPFWSMADPRRALHRATLATAPERPVIPYAAAIENMGVRRAPVTATQPAGPASRAYAGLLARIEQALQAPNAAA